MWRCVHCSWVSLGAHDLTRFLVAQVTLSNSRGFHKTAAQFVGIFWQLLDNQCCFGSLFSSESWSNLISSDCSEDVQSPFFAQDYLQTLLILFIFLLYTALGMLLVYVPYYASSWPLFLCSPALPNPVRARFWFMDFCKRIQKVYKKDQKPLTSKQRQKHKLGGFCFLNVQPYLWKTRTHFNLERFFRNGRQPQTNHITIPST